MNATATDYFSAVAAVAEDIVRQIEDGTAPARRCPVLTAGGYYVEEVRIFYADIIGGGPFQMPAGVARVALDVGRPRRPSHEVRVCLDPPGDGTTYDADQIAAAVLARLDSTADYAR
jgi:hypothetical protein